MTTVTFHMEGDRISGFTARGHSGLAEEGADILCAAITSAVRMTECAVNDVLGLEASVKTEELLDIPVSPQFLGQSLSSPSL